MVGDSLSAMVFGEFSVKVCEKFDCGAGLQTRGSKLGNIHRSVRNFDCLLVRMVSVQCASKHLGSINQHI